MPDSPNGIRARVQDNERRLDAVDGSVARLGERIGTLETAVAVTARDVLDVAGAYARVEKKLDALAGRPSWTVATLLTLETTVIAILATLLTTH